MGIGQAPTFPLLGRRMVDFKNSEVTRPVGLTVGECIKSSPEDDVLPQASGKRFGEAILGISASQQVMS